MGRGTALTDTGSLAGAGEPTGPVSWVAAAAAARQILVDRFWTPRAQLFATDPSVSARVRCGLRLGPWHYWWQAHALEVLLDGHEAGDRRYDPLVGRLLAGMQRRAGVLTAVRATDDRAWLGLAFARAHDLGLCGPQPALALCLSVLADRDPALGGVRWTPGDDYLNVASTGPAILLALRVAAWDGDLALTAWALEATEWLHEHAVVQGRVRDGVRWRGPESGPSGLVPEGPVYSYNVGLVAGVDLAVAAIPGQPEPVRRQLQRRAGDVLAVGCAELAPGGGPWRFEGFGDPVLFRGILARHLGQYLQADPVGADGPGLGAVLLQQASAVLASGTPAGLYPADWGGPMGAELPSGPRGGRGSGLAAQLSAAYVLAAAARLRP